MVVDDDDALQRLVSTLLTRAEMEIISAESAVEAADLLKRAHEQGVLPHVLVLDMMLPDVSGLDFLRQLREQSQFDTVRVVVLSAIADHDKIREGLEIGADRYLTKSYLANNLIATIQDLLALHHQRR